MLGEYQVGGSQVGFICLNFVAAEWRKVLCYFEG